MTNKIRNTANYVALPYNPKLRGRARELRKAGNMAEVALWLQIKNKQFLELDFDRQKIIGNYIVDFYSAQLGLVIEIDGLSHDTKQEYDRERDEYLLSLGLHVCHVTDVEVKENMSGVLKNLKEVVDNLYLSTLSTTTLLP